MHNIAPQNRREALTEALVLSVTAPSNEQYERALELAKQIAHGMPELDVKRAQKDAETRLANIAQETDQ